jgi:hypothetical protein
MPKWDSNPRSQCWSRRSQFVPYTARPLRSAAVGIRHADNVAPSIRKKLSLTSLTSGGRSVGIVRLRTQAMEFFMSVFEFLIGIWLPEILWKRRQTEFIVKTQGYTSLTDDDTRLLPRCMGPKWTLFQNPIFWSLSCDSAVARWGGVSRSQTSKSTSRVHTTR